MSNVDRFEEEKTKPDDRRMEIKSRRSPMSTYLPNTTWSRILPREPTTNSSALIIPPFSSNTII